MAVGPSATGIRIPAANAITADDRRLARMFGVNNENSQVSASRPAPSMASRLVRGAVTVGLLGVVFGGVFPRLADYSDVVPVITDLNGFQIVVLILLALCFLAAYWPVLMTVIPTLRWKEAAVNQLTGTAISNTVPAGGAVAVGVNYAMYVSWGFKPERVWAGLLAAGVWDGLLKAGMPLVALVLLAVDGTNPGIGWAVPVTAATVLTVLSVIVIVVLRSERGAQSIARGASKLLSPLLKILRRPGLSLEARMASFRKSLSDVLARSWGQLTVAMAVNHGVMFAIFVASVRFVGVDGVSLPGLLVAFSLARLLSGVPLTPGGVGLVDAGYVGLLLLLSPGAAEATIVGGVLLFRALTFFPPIPLGLASWLFWRSNTSWRQPAATRSSQL